MHKLDRMSLRRYEAFDFRQRGDGGRIDPTRIFSNPRILKSLSDESIFLPRFNVPQTLTVALLSRRRQFVQICPACMSSEENISALEHLTAAEIVLPILTAPVDDFPRPAIELLERIDHIGFWDFELYRFASLSADGMQAVCQSCAERQQREILSSLPIKRTLRSRLVTRLDAEIAFDNLFPFVTPDHQLLDLFTDVSRDRGGDSWRRLVSLSFAVKEVRTAEALNAVLVFDDESPAVVRELPDGYDKLQWEREKMVVEGQVLRNLRVQIPDSLPPEAAVELIPLMRPLVAPVVSDVFKTAGGPSGAIDMSKLQQAVTDINYELARLVRTKRYMVWEALPTVVRRHAPVIAKAGLLGLAFGSALGTAAALIGTLAPKRRKPALESNALARTIQSRVRRYIDEVAAKPLGTTQTAMHVLSTRRLISGRRSDRSRAHHSRSITQWHPH